MFSLLTSFLDLPSDFDHIRPESVSTQRILDLVVSLRVSYHCVYGIGPLAHYKYMCTCTSMRRTHCRDVESSPHNN
jgi:hypothetical protein